MAVKDRSTLTGDVNTIFADNISMDISEADLRGQSIDDIDSNFNLTDDDSDNVTEGAVNLFLTTTERTKVARDWTIAVRVEGVDFTALDATLTLPIASPGDAEGNVEVDFDGIPQQSTEWGVSGTTITFTSPIPVGVNSVELRVLA